MSRPILERISFLTPGSFPPGDPAQGLEETLRLFALAEKLGYDGGWVRQRHLENSVSSSATLLAAATQRTSRIALGVAVIQMDYETPFRLAEDLATVDVLSGGRLNVGLSIGRPHLADRLGALFPQGGSPADGDPYAPVLHLKDALSGRALGPEDARIISAAGSLRPRVQPVAPGLGDRLWYGAGSAKSVEWAARNGLNLLAGNIQTAGEKDDFATTQRRNIELFRSRSKASANQRVEIGRVILPLNSAGREARQRYKHFARERYARTLAPNGERRTQYARDLVGGADEIVEALLDDAAIAATSEIRIELPYNFSFEDYSQILQDFSQLIAPFLGWRGGPFGDQNENVRDGNVIAFQRAR